MVSRDSIIVGDIHFSGKLDVEGLVQGNIVAKPDTDACVRVVDKGGVEGDISAPSVVVNGSIEGDVHSSRHLELASKAKVQGSVFYTMVEMAVGSQVNGSLKHVAAPVESAVKSKTKEQAMSGSEEGAAAFGKRVASAPGKS